MKKSEKFSVRRRAGSFLYAYNGFIKLIKNEHNSRIQIAVFILVVVMGILFKIEREDWMLIIVVSGIVFLSELFNSAIEKLSDVISPEWNKEIGLIKDYSAGAVLVSSVTALIIGGLVFIPEIAEVFSHDYNL
jgi:diacylglycerol kinase